MSDEAGPGRREQKRQQTRQRIIDAGLSLFRADGFEPTTIDAIALAAGISRRSFFHYFKSKDEIVLSLHKGFAAPLAQALAQRPEGQGPFAAVRQASIRIAEGYPLEDLIAIDRLMLSSPVVRASKQAGYARDEAELFESLRSCWPEADALDLRLLAMVTIGIARVSLDAWRDAGADRPLAEHVAAAFDAIGAWR
ncbi:MAG: TetR family transcriptional regulator [Devosia sp.]|uniref:TetR/AcrR family transcriptional regulator n=1 Tax=Devosia sp. TaxID=1871048 RepID=UPI0024CD0B7D|nr:TetR/AcrR family transcriptional regulator [Devosia sp.]UYN99401.1 MAG: TetR family transcriptional regulator [Devosia sp.]